MSHALTKHTFTHMIGRVFDPCNQELVNYTGDLHTITALSTPPRGWSVINFPMNVLNMEAVGDLTDMRSQYRCHQRNLIIAGPITTPSIQTRLALRILSSNNAMFSGLAHLTVDATGDTVGSFEDVATICTA